MKKHLVLNAEIYKENYLALTKFYGKKPGAALKNNAYGLGLLDIAPIIEELGCEYYFIYNLDEGINLRKKLFSKDNIIISLGNIEGERIGEYLEYNITPTIGSLEEIKLYKYILLCKIPFAIYFDTGLHGKGVMWDSVEEIYPLVKELPVKIILSHLSSAWKADNTKNQLQKQRFNEIIKVFDNKNILYSLSNTDGSRLGSEFTLNIPRTGRGIHGLSYYNSVFGVRKAFEVFAYVVQIKRIKAGAEIGYGGYVKTNEDINLACINIGAYIINQINFPFANEVIWNNQTFNVITIFLGYMMVDFKNSLPNYMDKVELVFYSRFNPETLK